MVSGPLFALFRVLEILTLIPVWGMLAWFIDAYQPAQPPDSILYPFVVALLATPWALLTLLLYRRAGWTPLYICIVDLVFFGLLVGSLVLLAPSARHTNCITYSATATTNGLAGSGATVTVAANRQCMMLKSVWALSIVDCILFALTTALAGHLWHRSGAAVYEDAPRRHHRRSRRW